MNEFLSADCTVPRRGFVGRILIIAFLGGVTIPILISDGGALSIVVSASMGGSLSALVASLLVLCFRPRAERGSTIRSQAPRSTKSS